MRAFVRFLVLAALLACLTEISHAQAPSQSWQWAAAPSDSASNGSGVADVALDAAGNGYVAGTFQGTITLGATTLTSADRSDVFVAKLSPTGQWLWAVRAGGARDDQISDLSIDARGNAYVGGFFTSDSVVFGAITLVNQSQRRGYDGYVASLSASGVWQWARPVSGPGLEGVQGVAPDNQGHLYVTGIFGDPSAGGFTTTVGDTTLTSVGYYDGFVARLDTSGAWQWVQQAGSAGLDAVRAIAVDSSDNVYVNGGGADPFRLDTTQLLDSYVARLSPGGTWQWVARYAAGFSGFRFAVDAAGNSFLTGSVHNQTCQIGTMTIRSVSNDTSILYVAKLSAGGAWQWVATGGRNRAIDGFTVAVDAAGIPYVAGATEDRAATFGTTVLPSICRANLFVARLDPLTGAWQGAIQADSGTFIAYAVGLAAAPDGSLLVAGNYDSAVVLGPIILQSHSLNGQGFVAKLGPETMAVPAASSDQAAFALWPNPATRTVRLTGLVAASVEIFDVLGRVVLRSPVPAGQAEVTLSVAGLPPGLYVVRCGGATRRLVVE